MQGLGAVGDGRWPCPDAQILCRFLLESLHIGAHHERGVLQRRQQAGVDFVLELMYWVFRSTMGFMGMSRLIVK